MDSNLLKCAGIYRIRVDRGRGKSIKFYIGQAVNLKSRRKGHFKELRQNYHGNPRLQAAFNKYGQLAFSFEVLLVCQKDPAILTFYEQLIVDSYPKKILYNVHVKCVRSPLGRKMPPSFGAKISKAHKGRKQSEEQRANTSAALIGHPTSLETKAKIAATLTGRKDSDETRAKKSAGLTGRTLSQEHRQNIKRGLSGIKRTPEQNDHNSAAHKGKKRSLESIEKGAAKRRGRKRTFSSAHCAALSVACSKPRSEKQLANLTRMSAGNVGRTYSPVRNARISWSKYKDKIGILALDAI